MIWLFDTVRPEEIDSIISAEIPDPSTDQLLFNIVTTNMIHDPCGNLNRLSPCMADEKCIKRFPKDFTCVDRYPKNHRRNTDNCEQSFTKNINNANIDVDNH